MEGTIIYDPLPEENTTLYLRGVTVDKFLTILLARFPQYKIKVDADYYFVKRENPEESQDSGQGGMTVTKKGQTKLRKVNGFYSINQDKVRFKELINDLFNIEGKEYSLFTNRDTIIENFNYSNKDFHQMLRLLLEQSNADYSVLNEVYYIYEVQQRDILKKLFTTIYMPVKYISVRDLPNLLPSDLSSGRFYKLDINRNAIMLYGSIE
jgi:general secretion pathway protein D/type IV pilus assembly protein PilQ